MFFLMSGVGLMSVCQSVYPVISEQLLDAQQRHFAQMVTMNPSDTGDPTIPLMPLRV